MGLKGTRSYRQAKLLFTLCLVEAPTILTITREVLNMENKKNSLLDEREISIGGVGTYQRHF
jgi:hypothetical protein